MSTRVLHALVLFVLLLATSVPGQSPPAQPPISTDSAVDQQVQEMRRQLVEGKKFKSHVRVTVRLNNGNVIRGVVKDGQLVERVDGLRFVAAEANHPSAGMRVYYWNGTGSYVFVPFTDMRDYRINERLTPAQLRTLEQENKARDEKSQRDHEQAVMQAEAEAAALAAAAAEAKVVEGQGETTPPKSKQGATKVPRTDAAKAAPQSGALTEEQKQLYSLVQEFPPQAGWNEQKRNEIARRVAVVGATPSAAEKRFVERFSDWQKACELFGLTPSAPTPGGETTTGGSR